MKTLYLVFDQLPPKTSGGLIATYTNLVDLLKDDYTIKIISVFNFEIEAIDNFRNIEVLTLSKMKINNRFYQMFSYFKEVKLFKFAFALFSFVYFFMFIPIGKMKIKKIIRDENYVIACAPAAGIFISKSIKFILEIHTKFEYFWGDNILGRLQVRLMNKPVLTLFRNKYDATKGSKLFKASYIYNFFDDSCIDTPKFNYQKRKNKIIFMGRLNYQKDPIRLLECASLLKDRIPDFDLDIYGEGPMKEEIIREINLRSLQDNVHLCGFANDKSVYNNYSLLWLTSSFEGFGLVIIEAKANMVPTISVKWGGAVYEVIQDGIDGFVEEGNYEFVERTIELLNDEDKLCVFSKSGLKDFKEKFSKEMFKEKWIEILENYKNIE